MAESGHTKIIILRGQDIQKYYFGGVRTYKNITFARSGHTKIILWWSQDLQNFYFSEVRTYKNITLEESGLVKTLLLRALEKGGGAEVDKI